MIPLPNSAQNQLAGAPSAIPGGAPQDDAQPNPLEGTPSPRDWRTQLAGAADKLGIPAPQSPIISADTNAEKGPDGHLDKFAAGMNEAAKQNPNPGAPGAWARNVLAGTAAAIGNLGDAAHATDNLKPGQGGLSGVLNTLNAQKQRQAQEKQQKFDNNLKMTKEAREAQNDRVANAMTEAQTLNLGVVRSKLMIENDAAAQKLREDTDAHAQLQIDGYKKAHYDVEEHVGTDDLHQRMSAFAKNPPVGPDGKPQAYSDVYTVVPMGDMKVQGPDGKTGLAQTVSIVKKNANPVHITPAIHDFLTEYLPKGSVPPVDTDMPGHGFDSQMTQASQVAAATAQIDNFMGEKVKFEKDRNLQGALITASHFMAQDVNDPFVGLEAGIKQADQHVQQGQQQLALAQKAGDPDKIQQAQTYVTQSQKEKSDLETVVNSPTLAQAREKHWEIQTKAQEKKDAADSNISNDTARALVEGTEDTTMLSKKASTYNKQIDAAREYARNNSLVYDPAQRANDLAYAKNKGTQDTLKYFNSLVGSAGHAGNLSDLVKMSDSIDRTDFPPINDVEAWGKLKSGNPQMAAYLTNVTEVADQVAKILQGGTTGSGTSDAKLKQAADMFQTGFTKNQIRDVAATLNGLLNNRQREMIGDNIYLLRKYGTKQQVNAAMQGKDPWGPEYATNQSQMQTTAQQQGGGQQPAKKFAEAPHPNMTRLQKPNGDVVWVNNNAVDNLIKIYGAKKVQ